MIISEDRSVNDPDDEAGGGQIVFLFDNPVPLDFVEILDIDFNEVNGYILVWIGDDEEGGVEVVANGRFNSLT